MHDGCAGSFENGQQVADKVRMMGFNIQPMPMPMPMEIDCVNCGESFQMVHFEESCPKCEMVYAVTPCHSHDPANVMPAGIRY